MNKRLQYAIAAVALFYLMMVMLGMDPFTASQCKLLAKNTEGRKTTPEEAQRLTQCITGTTGAPFLFTAVIIAAAAYALGK